MCFRLLPKLLTLDDLEQPIRTYCTIAAD